MPRGPKGENAPPVIGSAMIARIATGEIEEGAPPDEGKAGSGRAWAQGR
jgi:hypothetical protein